MKKFVRKLAKQAGFNFWRKEAWKPNGDIIDWSSNYDAELERFYELVVEAQVAKASSDRLFEKAWLCG